jgi:small subunit ribosomal protein S3
LGHKVHPIGFRLGVVKGWQSRWYAERDYKDVYGEDRQIRARINKELANAAVSRIEIERAAANQVLVKIYTAKPGIVIGKSGEKVEKLKTALEAQTKKRVRLEINEIRQPELDAYLVARGIAEQLEKRVSFRRAMKQAVQKSMRANAKGVKVICGGRLGGAEIARSEKEVEGKVPLHTLRADIDYGLAEAHTTFGVIGIKVWIYRGDILPSKRREQGEQAEAVAQPAFTPREGGERRERGERGPRPQGERPRYQGGERGERGPRPQGERPQGERPARAQGDRPRYQGGERPPRPQGERAQGERQERAPRPQGERTERGPRPQGERPQGERAERGPRPQGDRPQGERSERGPRPQGERSERGPRPQGDRAPRGERTGAAPTPASEPTAETPHTPPTVQTPDVPQSGTSETQQSE